jgi:hypothetical protein
MEESLDEDTEMSESNQVTSTPPAMDSAIIPQSPKASPAPKSNQELLLDAVKTIATATASAQAATPTAPSESNSNGLNPDETAQSVPMTATTSTSSHQDAKDSNATSYGTRSTRNRTGNSRPNYAEDTEMEFEQSTQSRVDASSGLSPSVASRKSPPANTNSQKRAATTNSNTNGWNAVNNTSSIPGTSTFSANPNVTVQKKRKAAAAATPSSNGHPSAKTSTVSRRSHTLNQVGSKETRVSDVYTFEKCGLKLKNNNLVADDGTVFKQNGELVVMTSTQLTI